MREGAGRMGVRVLLVAYQTRHQDPLVIAMVQQVSIVARANALVKARDEYTVALAGLAKARPGLW